MGKLYNIYCDESCHLETDSHKSMIIGAVWCSDESKRMLFDRIKEIKKEHNLKSGFEIKWNKVSDSKVDFYKDLINFFFDSDKINFRAYIVADKSELDHEKYGQTHDEFYYKTYFDMLKIIVSREESYNIYLDLKDTQGKEKVQKLQDTISNAHYDFSKKIVRNIQEVRSEQVCLMQLADLLIGAFSYAHRDLKTNTGKMKLIELIKKRSGYSMMKSTLPTERKFNYFIWHSGFKRGGNNYV